MSKKSMSNDDIDGSSYDRIKVPESNDTYLEAMSGRELIDPKDIQQTTCSKCGLSARNKEELQDHISHAHAHIHGHTEEEMHNKETS